MKRSDFLQSRHIDGKTSFSMLGVTFEEVMNLPISCLELSGLAKRFLVDSDVKLTATLSKKIKTIGDLVGIGYDNLEYYLMQKCPNSYESVMYSVEVALAKFSLRLSGSEFSVYDISVNDLGLSAHTIKVLEKNYLSLVEQICTANGFLVSRFSGSEEGKAMLKQIKVALRNFGVKFKTKPVNSENKPKPEPKAEGSVPKIPKIFPKILENINKVQAEAKASTEKNLSLEDIDYSNCEYDYSGLLNIIRTKFATINEFKKNCNIDKRTLKLILKGDKIYRGTLEKLSEYFGVEPRELVTYNCKVPPCTVNGVTYDYAKILTKLFSKYTNQHDIKIELNMSTDTLRKMMNGQPVQRSVILKLCSALNIRPQDIITLEPSQIQSKTKILPDVDYSKLLMILKKNALSIQALCDRLGIGPFQSIYYHISKGNHLKPQHLAAMANYLSVPQQELVTINRSIGEVKQRRKKARNKVVAEYDYSTLLNLIYYRFRTDNIEEVGKKYGISERAIQNIRLGRKITDASLKKLARLLECPPGRLYTKIYKSESQTALAPENDENDRLCDYTKLQLLFDKNFKNMSDASRKTGIPRGIFTKINNGELLGFTTYKKFMDYFHVGIDDLCEFKNNEDKMKIMNMIYRNRESKSSPNYMDFSNLLDLLKKRKISHNRFKEEAKISNESFTRILNNRKLSNETLKKITGYLQCDLSDIIDINYYKGSIPSFEDKPYDYSKLYKILEERNKNMSWLVEGAGLSSTSYTHFFKTGKKVSDQIIQKICTFLGCTPEDIVSPNPEVISKLREEYLHRLRQPRRKRVVAVHSDKLLPKSVTETNANESTPNQDFPQPELAEIESNAETPQNNAEDMHSASEGSGKSTNPPNVKFYFGETGYINMFGERVKKHTEKTMASLPSEPEILERTI